LQDAPPCHAPAPALRQAGVVIAMVIVPAPPVSMLPPREWPAVAVVGCWHIGCGPSCVPVAVVERTLQRAWKWSDSSSGQWPWSREESVEACSQRCGPRQSLRLPVGSTLASPIGRPGAAPSPLPPPPEVAAAVAAAAGRPPPDVALGTVGGTSCPRACGCGDSYQWHRCRVCAALLSDIRDAVALHGASPVATSASLHSPCVTGTRVAHAAIAAAAAARGVCGAHCECHVNLCAAAALVQHL
jgi:hypothetical protein